MQNDGGFGNTRDESSIKAKSVHLIASVRTVMRSTSDRIVIESPAPGLAN